MANGIKAVRSEEMGLGKKKTWKVFEVSGLTLKDKVNSKETVREELINTRLGRKPVLPCGLDEALVSYCLTTACKCSAITTSKLSN